MNKNFNDRKSNIFSGKKDYSSRHDSEWTLVGHVTQFKQIMIASEPREQQKIAAYCLLAQINEQSTNIGNIREVFLPLVKRALASLSAKGIKSGTIQDAKEEVDRIFALDVPYPILRTLLDKIQGAPRGHLGNFRMHSDGSFFLEDFVFTDFHEAAENHLNELESIERNYSQFLIAKNQDPEKSPSLYSFLELNRLSLASFFGKGEAPTLTQANILQAEYIESLRKDASRFAILRSIYFGAIIAAYLELDFGERVKMDFEFLLDTNVIVALLNLASVESVHTCQSLLKFAKALGCKLTVLSETIDETKNLLLRKAGDIVGQAWESLNSESIFAAFQKNGLGKTDVERLALHLESKISEFGISAVSGEKYERMAQFSKEYEILKVRPVNPEGALHDATAIEYVKVKRGKKIDDFANSKCWFVTNPRGVLHVLKVIPGLPQVITASEMLSLLWLSSPGVKGEALDVGLTKLLSSALAEKLPSGQSLRIFGRNVEKYRTDGITDEDIVHLANKLGRNEMVPVDSFNETADEDPEAFKGRLAKLIEEARNDDRHREEVLSKTKADSDAAIKKLTLGSEKALSEERRKALDILRTELENAKNENNKKALQTLRPIFEREQSKLAEMESRAEKFGRVAQLAYTTLPVGLAALGYVEFQTLLSTLLPLFSLPLFRWCYEGMKDKSMDPRIMSPTKIKSGARDWRFKKLIIKNSFNTDEHNELDREIKRLSTS